MITMLELQVEEVTQTPNTFPISNLCLMIIMVEQVKDMVKDMVKDPTLFQQLLVNNYSHPPIVYGQAKL